MLNDSLLTFLNIRPDEVRKTSLVAGLFLSVLAAQAIGENAGFALFLSSIRLDYLPYMYIGRGAMVFLTAAIYAASLTRFQNASVVRKLLGGAALFYAIEWVVLAVDQNTSLYALVWLTAYGMNVVFTTLLWTSAGEVCDARQAKRLFPLFMSMGILGVVLGNLATGPIVSLFNAEALVLFYALLMAGAYYLLKQLTREFFPVEKDAFLSFNLWRDLQSGYEFVRASQMFRLLSIAAILFSILFYLVEFPFSEKAIEVYAGDAAGLAWFKGIFTSVTTLVMFLVSLFISKRLYVRLGMVNSLLILPVTYTFAFLLFFASFTFQGAVGARFAQLVVLGAIAGTAWNSLFNVIPPERRGQVLAFNNGVPAQIGVALAGLFLILARQVLATRDMILLGAGLALVVVYITLRMRGAYGDALLAALRAGRADVFSEDEASFSEIQNDPAALQTLLKSLQDPRADTRRLAADMLGRMGNKSAVPDLLERLSDDDASVRAASIHALAELGASAAARVIIRKLKDPHDSVREATLASLPKLQVASSPELIFTLEEISKERRNVRLKARAAVALTYFGRGHLVRSMLYRLLKNKDSQKRQAGFDALIHIAEIAPEKMPFRARTILAGLNDPSPVVRRETVRLWALLKIEAGYESILPRLGDEDDRVRKMASESLKQIWPQPRSGIIRILDEMRVQALDAALDAIPLGVADILELTRGYIQHEVSRIWYLRMLIYSFTGLDGKFTAFLVDTLTYRVHQSEDRLIKAVGLFGNMRALEVVRRSLNSGDANTRAAALETLETLGDPIITKEVLPILDRGGIFVLDDGQKLDLPVVMSGLLESQDHWQRAIAARVVSELGLVEFLPVLKKLQKDAAPLVRRAARDALVKMDGESTMKTLKTLSTLDRILLLREIPMFVGLSPDDLEKIAEVSVEQYLPARSLITREGERGDSMFIIVSGDVSVLKKTDEGEAVLAVRTSGEFVGEMAIIESSTRSATLLASSDVRLLVLDGDAFKSILHDRPEVAISVLRHMSRVVRELNERVLERA